jgi:Tfp pilus assembly protein PilF
MQHWLQNDGDDIRVREKLAEVYRSGNRIGGAVYQYRKILKINPEHLIALNNLGWLLLDEESEQALSYAEKAANLYPNSDAVMDTLAMTQLKNERVIEARRSIDRVLRMDSRNPEFRYHEVLIRLAEGDTTGASTELTNLLENPVNFLQRAEAETLSNSLN